MKNFKYVLTLFLIMSGFVLYGQNDTTKHIIEYGYRMDRFSNETTRHFKSLQYGYRFENKNDNYNTILVKTTHQIRENQTAWQHALDYYPTTENGYYHFSARYSNSDLFPTWMGFAEYFRSFGKRHELSAGARYLNALQYYDIYSITGTYGIYYGSFYTYVRPIYSILEEGEAWSGQIVTRYYSGDGKSYVEGMYLRGVDITEMRPVAAIENSFGLNTQLYRIRTNIHLTKNWYAAVGVDHSIIDIPKANQTFNQLGITGFDIMIKKKF